MANKKDLDKIFDNWLFSSPEVRERYNPFLAMFKKIFSGLPQVKSPEITDNKDLKNENDIKLS